jgi:hypothetical protein
MRAFDAAWSVIKALPEDQVFEQRGDGRFETQPTQERFGTVHPAIRGLLQRLHRGVGPDGYTDFNRARPSMQFDPPRHWSSPGPKIEDLGTLYEDPVETIKPSPGSSQHSLDIAQRSHGVKELPYFEDEDQNLAFFAQYPTRSLREAAIRRREQGQPMRPSHIFSRFSRDSVPYREF